MPPKVTVLMSVYNGERYLQEAIDSILNQTFTNFEFVIIDDRSTDGTRTILDRYTDSRIVRLYNDQNIGLTRSLNRGLKVAHGQVIARQDADDISLPARLAKQVAYLEEHPQVGLLGTQIKLLNRLGLPLNAAKLPASHSLIVWTLLFRNAFAHPTVMMRKSILDQVGGYDPSFQVTQDYELWTRLIGKTRFANLLEALVIHRRSWGSVSARQAEMQKANTHRIIQRVNSWLLREEVSTNYAEWINQSRESHCSLTNEQIKQTIAFLIDLYGALRDRELLRYNELDEIQAEMLDTIVAVSRCMSHTDRIRTFWWSICPRPLWRVIRVVTALLNLLRGKFLGLQCI